MTSEESYHWAAAVYCGSYSWMGKAILRNWGVHILINAYVLYDHAPSFIFLIFLTSSFGFCRSSRQRKRCAEVWKHCALFGLHEAGWAHHWWLQICCFSYYTYWNTTLKSLTSVLFFPLPIYFRSKLCGGSFCRWSTGRAQIWAPIHMFAVSAERAANRNAPPFDWTETSAEVSGKAFQAFFSSPPGEPFSKCIPPFLFFRWN